MSAVRSIAMFSWSKSRSGLYALVLLLFSLYLLTLGARPLVLPDETRYAEISREMIASGDWITPRFLGLRYFEKPVLGYWFNALSQKAFGQTNFAVRFASALSAGGTALLLLWWLLSVCRCARVGAASAAVYLSFTLVFAIGVFSVLDSMLALFLTAAMVAFHGALQAASGRQRCMRYALFGCCCGLAFLTKGFVALAVPAVALVPFMIWSGRLRELLLWGWIALLSALLVATPWALAVHAREPDYWHYFFWEEHIKRFAADNAQHKAPLWYFVPVLLAGAMPWTPALALALRGLRRRSPAIRATTIYLLCWVIFPFLFFSIAKGKLGTYILPCFAPLAALLALGFVAEATETRLSLRFIAWVNLVFAGLLAALLLGFVAFGFKDERLYSDGEWYKPLALTVALLVWAWLAWLARSKCSHSLRSGASAVAAIALMPATFMLVLPLAAPGSAVYSQTPQSFIAAHADRIDDNTLLLSSDVGLAAALGWQFSRSEIVLYNAQGELSYGLGYADAGARYISREAFPGWLTQQRSQTSVALFIRLKKDRRIEALPQADFDRAQGRFRFVLYQQRH